MKICGIDPSINSSGKCILTLDDSYDIIDVKLYAYNITLNRCISDTNFMVESVGTKYAKMNMFDRQNVAYTIMKRDMDEVKHVAFEGYAMGAGKQASRSLIQMGEFIGGLKKLFYDAGKGIIIYPPKVVKKFATGNGNADKSMMSAAFKSYYPQYYPEGFLKLPQNEDPHSDMCDAFWIAETLRCHLKYEICGAESMDPGTVALLEDKSSKKSDCILDTKLVKCK